MSRVGRQSLPVAWFTVFAVLATGQTRSSGAARTSGTCSPANTGNNNAFNITCGIGREQGQKMLDIVNKILANQIDPDAVMNKLDEIQKGIDGIRQSVANRHLSESQKSKLISLMSRFKREKVTVEVASGDAEAYRYAQEFVAVFRQLGFNFGVFAAGAADTGVNELQMMGAPPRVGVYIEPLNEGVWRKPIVQMFVAALAAAHIPYTAQYSGNFGEWAYADLRIYIGKKPTE